MAAACAWEGNRCDGWRWIAGETDYRESCHCYLLDNDRGEGLEVDEVYGELSS